MTEFQRTIAAPVILEGIGLHSGVSVKIVVKPAVANSGVVFIRTDLSSSARIEVCPQNAVEGVTRCTAIAANGAQVMTIEHLLAAFNGLGIDNAIVEINAEEVPGLDGSSLEFVQAFKKAGIKVLDAPKQIIEIQEPLTVTANGASITIEPANEFIVNYTLEYDHPQLKKQIYSGRGVEGDFEAALAPARTFCLESEVAQIRAHGLGKGANERNTLIIGNDGPIGNSLRFKDECARHKALDIVGDLFLLGQRVHGRVTGVKSGHALNRQLVHKITEQTMTKKKIYDINDIMRILPHRYPFLLVDRVIEVDRGKKGIGIKNVTINDGFFQGHFPQRPVMPGVLMVEAMAQTAGVVVLTSGAHDGKVALFMSIDAVKFRKVVVPGDQLMMEIEIIRDRERTAQVKGVGKVDGEIVVEAEMLFSYTDAEYLSK